MSELKEDIVFSDGLNAFIEEWKKKPGNLIMILHKIQEEFGYVPRAAAEVVAKRVGTPLATIYGVLSFYHFFKLTKPGKHNIQVCMGTACYLKNSEMLIEEIGHLLGLPLNEITEDGKFSLEAVRCVGCCGLAHVMTIGGVVFGKVTKDQIPGIIAKFS